MLLSQAIVTGLIELFGHVRMRLRPTPAHAHYVFTMHEFARVLQGMLLMSPRSKIKPKRRSRNDLVSRQSEFTSRATTALSSIAPHSTLPPYSGAPSARSHVAYSRSTQPMLPHKYACTFELFTSIQ